MSAFGSLADLFLMSAFPRMMSALPPKRTFAVHSRDVRFVPLADIARFKRKRSPSGQVRRKPGSGEKPGF